MFDITAHCTFESLTLFTLICWATVF